MNPATKAIDLGKKMFKSTENVFGEAATKGIASDADVRASTGEGAVTLGQIGLVSGQISHTLLGTTDFAFTTSQVSTSGTSLSQSPIQASCSLEGELHNECPADGRNTWKARRQSHLSVRQDSECIFIDCRSLSADKDFFQFSKQ